MSPELKDSLHVLSPGDKSLPHVHSIITGRKSWKTLKGKTEAVWPPYLETALFEGLAKYQPSNPRATKSLGRFPNRNRFISEHILKSTGKYRTPKQVGSRLQQLRDTCQGKQLLQNLSRGHLPSSDDNNDGDSAVSSPVDSPSEPDSQPPPRTVVAVDILPENGSSRQHPLNGSDARSPYGSPATTPLSSPASPSFPPLFKNCEPRSIRMIDPTVTFTSRSSMVAYSSFSVLLDGACVHTEVADLKLSTASCPVSPFSTDVECIFFYSTTLVSQYWQHICESSDPTRYTIVQDIIQQNDPSTAESSRGSGQKTVLSVEYKFNYPDTPYPSPQLSPTDTMSSSSSLPSPTSYNFDFMSGYSNGDCTDRAYVAEPSIVSHGDFMPDPSSLCIPEYPASNPRGLSVPDLGLNVPQVANSFFDMGSLNANSPGGSSHLPLTVDDCSFGAFNPYVS